LSIDQIKSAGFRRYYPGIAKATESQWSKSTAVSNCNQFGGREEEHRKSAFRSTKHFGYCLSNRCRGTRDTMQHNFRVGSRRKDRAFAFESLSLFFCKRQVTVMAYSDLTMLTGHEKRLSL